MLGYSILLSNKFENPHILPCIGCCRTSKFIRKKKRKPNSWFAEFVLFSWGKKKSLVFLFIWKLLILFWFIGVYSVTIYDGSPIKTDSRVLFGGGSVSLKKNCRLEKIEKGIWKKNCSIRLEGICVRLRNFYVCT